jgi:3-phenylpropionate/trans-cinnamate dioxygenase ferredoxin reductase component
MNRADGHFVVVGAGQAGGRAIAELRNCGFSGAITLVGAEPSLPYERPPLSKSYLCDAQPRPTHVNAESYYSDFRVSVLTGIAAVELDRGARTLRLESGAELRYDRLLLCMGARPRLLDIPGRGLRGITYLRTLADAGAIRAALSVGTRLVVIGGGFVGLEIAATARLLGCDVTIVEAAGRLAGRTLPQAISDYFAALHARHGVRVRLGSKPVAFEGQNAVSAVHLEDGSSIPADIVVIGIGIEPETGLARAAGLAVDDGVLVDENCRTSDPDIWAAGDVTNHINTLLGRRLRLECWQNANDQAVVAARSMSGLEARHDAVPWMWSDQYSVNLQMAGVPPAAGQLLLRGSFADTGFSLFQLENERLTAAICVNRGVEMLYARRLIGQGRKVDQTVLTDTETSLQRLLA